LAIQHAPHQLSAYALTLKLRQHLEPGNERGQDPVADHVDETDDLARSFVDRYDDSKAASEHR
jgi:hypothetical protein